MVEKDLIETKGYAKYLSHQIVQTPSSTALRFNSFRGIMFTGFQSNGKTLLDECKILV